MNIKSITLPYPESSSLSSKSKLNKKLSSYQYKPIVILKKPLLEHSTTFQNTLNPKILSNKFINFTSERISSLSPIMETNK